MASIMLPEWLNWVSDTSIDTRTLGTEGYKPTNVVGGYPTNPVQEFEIVNITKSFMRT